MALTVLPQLLALFEKGTAIEQPGQRVLAGQAFCLATGLLMLAHLVGQGQGQQAGFEQNAQVDGPIGQWVEGDYPPTRPGRSVPCRACRTASRRGNNVRQRDHDAG